MSDNQSLPPSTAAETTFTVGTLIAFAIAASHWLPQLGWGCAGSLAGAMTVLIYVNTSKQVGDPEHLKVFANAAAAETGLQENDPEGVAFEYEVLEGIASVAERSLPCCGSWSWRQYGRCLGAEVSRATNRPD